VSAATWERVKATGLNEHGTIFAETSARSGKATTQTPVGAVVLEFEFDAKAERITYTITKRPIIALSSLIWGGIESMIDRCRSA
jgi:hypothetical protein